MEATRRTLPDDIAELLRRRRRSLGWSRRHAATKVGTSHGYLWLLERGDRCPSVSMAEAIISGYQLRGHDAARLRECGLPGVGRDWRAPCGCDRDKRCYDHG